MNSTNEMQAVKETIMRICNGKKEKSIAPAQALLNAELMQKEHFGQKYTQPQLLNILRALYQSGQIKAQPTINDWGFFVC